jgi:TFIIF-interacting CTD phosphatase-like protein
MSSGGGIDLIIVSVAMLVRAIEELNLAHKRVEAMQKEKIKMQMTTGETVDVDVVVKDPNNRQIGFQKQQDGTYKVIADSAGLTRDQMRKQKDTINSIKRKYAYNMVVQELKKQGFQVVEEKKVEKDTVKLVARKWQ